MGFIRKIFDPPAPPAPVNFQQVGKDQAAANRETALLSAQIARPDVVSPYQTSRYLDIGGPDEDRWAITQTLAPEYEQMRQREAGIQGGLQTLAAQRLGQVDPQPFSMEGVPAEPGAFSYQQAAGDMPEFSTAGATYQLPEFSGLQGMADQATNQFYTSALDRIAPEFDRAEESLRTQLITSGLPVGSEAYNREIERFRQQKGDTLSQLATQSMMQGQQYARGQMADVLTGRQQQLSEIGTAFDVAGAQRAQRAQEARAERDMAMQARDRTIAERVRQRQQPLSELAAVLTGQTPFSQAAAAGPAIQPGGVAGPQPVDLGALAAAQQADAAQRYAAQQQGAQNWMNLAGTVGAGVLGNPGFFDYLGQRR
jgi:hypothetical protein